MVMNCFDEDKPFEIKKKTTPSFRTQKTVINTKTALK